MNIDVGIAVVIVAVLVFYLRLIILQRERAKRASQTPSPSPKKRRPTASQPINGSRYSILSQNRGDLVIAGIGMLAILSGVLLNAQVIVIPAAQPYWWLPTAVGIVAFSWAFKL